MRLQQTASKEHDIANLCEAISELDLRDQVREMEMEVLGLLNRALKVERMALERVAQTLEEEKLALQVG